MSLKPGNDDSNISLIQQAADSGINLFDTADLYDHGDNEKLLGKALHGIRDKVYIATKVGNRWLENRSGWDWVPTKEHILEAVNQSLKRLQTDYIDLYQLHGGTIDDNFDEVFETFELLKDQGKIRHYGISSIRPNVIREVVPKHPLSSVMVQYSLLDRRPEEFILPYLKKHKRGVLVRGSLAKGLLIDKPPRSYLSFSKEEIEEIQKLNESPITNSLSFVLSHDAISSAVIGIRNHEQLLKILEGYQSINKADFSKLAGQLRVNNYTDHL